MKSRKAGKGGKAAGRVKFRTYPYTVTRVRVMKSKLLKGEDYLRMRKMGLNEMIRFLEESEYKREIDSLSREYLGTELIELALNDNLANVVNKLLDISIKEEVKVLIEFYSLKWVLNNVKLVLRTKMNRLGETDLRYGLIPIKPMDYETSMKMHKEGEDEIFKVINRITHIDIHTLSALYRAGDLVGLENEIDVNFYSGLMELEKRLRLKKSDPLRQFFKLLVYLMNIKNIVKFKMGGIKEDVIRKLMVLDESGRGKAYSLGKRQEKLIADMIAANDMKALFDALRKSQFRDLVTAEVEENPTRLEGAIDKFLLMYASRLLHRRPLSVSPIFGYLLCKEIETKNIKLLVHAKAMGLDERFVDSNLILVDNYLINVVKNA
jgi:V/A-type H+-transporting ATPase subunit C